ncbi:MAG: choice-of-anchor D domain-containing protein, partial [Bacteriovoracaceae bacterium]|nr:choice-of-anchor D domain-containing protein [Bacteriovoracaceae bacterium]
MKHLARFVGQATTILFIAALSISCGDSNVSSEGINFAILETLPESTSNKTLVGTTNTITFQIKNSGDREATKINLDLVSSSNDLLWEGGNYPGTSGDCASILLPDQTCTLAFKFTPTTSIPIDFEITGTYFDGIEEKEITLADTITGAMPAQLDFYPGSYNFGSVVSGTTSTTLFTIVNTGDWDASTVAGSITTPFSFTGGSYPGTLGTCATDLEAGASCQLEIEFASPYASATYTNNLTLTYDNGIGSTSNTATITGSSEVFVYIDTPVASTYINSTNQNVFEFSGRCSVDGDLVTLTFNGSTSVTTNCTSSRDWTYYADFTSAPLSGVADGVVSVQADHSTASPDTVSLNKDVIAPAAQTLLAWGGANPTNQT